MDTSFQSNTIQPTLRALWVTMEEGRAVVSPDLTLSALAYPPGASHLVCPPYNQESETSAGCWPVGIDPRHVLEHQVLERAGHRLCASHMLAIMLGEEPRSCFRGSWRLVGGEDRFTQPEGAWRLRLNTHCGAESAWGC